MRPNSDRTNEWACFGATTASKGTQFPGFFAQKSNVGNVPVLIDRLEYLMTAIGRQNLPAGSPRMSAVAQLKLVQLR